MIKPNILTVLLATTLTACGGSSLPKDPGEENKLEKEQEQSTVLTLPEPEIISSEVEILSADNLYFSAPANSSHSGMVGGKNKDLNGDGFMDLILISGNSASDGTVKVLMNRGDGSFRLAQTFSSMGWMPIGAELGDATGDGILDLFVINAAGVESNKNTIAIFQGSSGGSFSLLTSIPMGTNIATSIAVADFNGDGKSDFVVSREANIGSKGTLAMYRKTATPDGYSVVQTENTNCCKGSVAVADLNGDGRLDIATARTGEGAVDAHSVFLGTGDGSFVPKEGVMLNGQRLQLEDVSGDGIPDALISGGSLRVRRGAGDGSFSDGTLYGYDSVYGGGALLVEDVNHDGLKDIVISGSNGDGNGNYAVMLMFGDGAGQFPKAAQLDTNGHLPIGISMGQFGLGSSMDLAITFISQNLMMLAGK